VLAAADLPVLATVVHPGGVRTHIADRASAAAERRGEPVTDEDRWRRNLYDETLLRMDPAQAARTVLDGVEAGRSRVLVGNDAKAVDLLVRLLPSAYPRVTRAFERRLSPTPAPGVVRA
jgi:short-subunit dehydrogenase